MAFKLPEQFAIMVFDPGATTGAARGLFRPCDTLAETLATGEDWETWEVTGPPPIQSREIAEEFIAWHFELHVERLVPVHDIHFISEDFQLRPSKAKGAGSDPRMLDPVRVTSGVEALMVDAEYETRHEVEKQMPGLAKGYATNDRLRQWGAWVVGSEHRRDANRHLCYRANMILSGR